MKRTLLAIALCALCATSVCAQNKLPVRLEIGAGLAPLFLMGVGDSFDVPYKADAYVEARYDLGEYFDVGLKADYKFNPIKGESPLTTAGSVTAAISTMAGSSLRSASRYR